METSSQTSEPLIRKTVSLPKSMWDEVDCYRAQQRIVSEAEAMRRLLQMALTRPDAATKE